MSLVSVIVPNFNNAQWLPACLESCLAQGPEWLLEIVVVDDGSQDGSWELLEGFAAEHPGIVRPLRNPGKGANLARNHGFAHCRGQFVQWLDSDDRIEPGKFATQVRFLRQNPGFDIAYSDWRSDFHHEGRFTHSESVAARQHDDYLLQLLQDNWQPCHSYLLSRRAAERGHLLQGWNPQTPVAQDREYFTRLAIEGFRFGHVPGEFAVYNRWGRQSISATHFKLRLEAQMRMDRLTRTWIAEKDFAPRQRAAYLAELDTQALDACFYHPSLVLNAPFSLFRLRWGRLHWKKRPIMPLLYLWQHLRYFVLGRRAAP